MARPRKYTDEQMIGALTATKGMVYLAAHAIGCDPGTIYDRAAASAKVKAAIRNERGKVVDTAELKLNQAVMNGEPWAIQMTLKTLGKDRGYVERTQTQEVTDEDLDAAIEAELAKLAARREGAAAGGPPGTNGAAADGRFVP